MTWLEDAARKLCWADEHLRVLEDDMGKKLGTEKYTVTREAQTEVTETSSKTIMGPMEILDPPDLPPEWSLLIGDFTFNARAALDHLAWELAASWTWRANKARRAGEDWPPKLYFPIYAYFKKPRDRKKLKTKLGNFSPTHRKTLAGAQPYKSGKLARAQPLWMLDQLRNVDAHRTLHTVLARVPLELARHFHHSVRATPGGGFSVQLPKDFEVFRIPGEHSFPLSPGDTLQTTLEIQANFAPYVTFDQPGADFDGQQVLPLLRDCRNEVERILGLF